MKQLTINDFFDILDEAAIEAANKRQEQDETPTEVDIDDFESEPAMTILENLVTTRITKHLTDGTFPSLEEAQTIQILDTINSKYND